MVPQLIRLSCTMQYNIFLDNVIIDPNSYCNYNTHFPCIILVDIGAVANLNFSFNHWLMMYAGPSLELYGCVDDGCIRVDPLTPTFDLSTYQKYEELRNTITSTFIPIAAVANIKLSASDVTVWAFLGLFVCFLSGTRATTRVVP